MSTADGQSKAVLAGEKRKRAAIEDVGWASHNNYIISLHAGLLRCSVLGGVIVDFSH